MQDSTFIVLDVHKATISVAVAGDERGGEVRHWGTLPHRPDHVRKLAARVWLLDQVQACPHITLAMLQGMLTRTIHDACVIWP